MRTIEIIQLGRIRYADAMVRMKERVERRTAGQVPDALFLLEHEPVLTLGRRGERSNIVASKHLLAERGVEVHETGRGGDVTYHGPGQIVGYPVIDLRPDRKSVRRYVGDLEDLLIATCRAFGVEAGRVEKMIGTWIDGERKIGAIGVRISKWITSHGFAFNVTDEPLDAFQLIVPCGIQDKGVTSLSRECGKNISVREVLPQMERAFLGVFDAERL